MKQLHKIWRKKFGESVFKRDDYKCRICGCKNYLDAHHITDRHDMPNGGYVLSNGISLCSTCHIKAETFHSSNHKNWIEGFHPNDLYKLIHSSFEEAYKDSLNLNNV
jgi:predicted restriction endonuclease